MMAEVTTRELAVLENRPHVTIIWRCRKKYYSLTRKVKTEGRAGGDHGLSWRIDIDDPRISEATRNKHYLTVYCLTLTKKTYDGRLDKIESSLSKLTQESKEFKEFMRKLHAADYVD